MSQRKALAGGLQESITFELLEAVHRSQDQGGRSLMTERNIGVLLKEVMVWMV